ncbi:MAG: DUF4365 domain-containing protein [Terriglobia bacterium]
MQRPKQHETDSQGEAQMRAIFAPLGWTVEEVTQDYGIDFEIEIFRDHQSTGMSFKVQLKSSTATRFSVSRRFISQSLKKRNAVRLCHEVQEPTAILHADVKSGKTYWLAPQLERETVRRLLTDKGKGTVTFRIPVVNELPQSLQGMIGALAQAQRLLATRVLIDTTAPDFVSSVKGRVETAQLADNLQDKQDMLRLEQARQLMTNKQHAEALRVVRAVSASPLSSVECRFWALERSLNIEFALLTRAGKGEEWPEAFLRTSRAMRSLVRRGPQPFRFFSLIVRKAAELNMLIERDFGLFLNWRANMQDGDPLWRLQLEFLRTQVFRKLVAKYNQCVRLIQIGANYSHRAFLPEAMTRVARITAPLILRLRQEEMIDIAQQYAASVFQICRLSAMIASRIGNERCVVDAALAAIMVMKTRDDEPCQWAKSVINQIKDVEIRTDGEHLVEVYLEQLTQEPDREPEDREAVLRQIYGNMARALGIDISNPNHPLAAIVRRGLDDLNPERVLRNCEHIFISFAGSPILSPVNILSNQLQLQSIRPKIIHCDLYNHAVPGTTLDEAYSVFQANYCKLCSDCGPRASEWKWTEDWQEEFNKQHAEFYRRFQESGPSREGRF